MRRGVRNLVFAVVVVALVAVAAWYGVRAFSRSQAERSAETDVARTDLVELAGEPHVVFRSTAPGQEYGHVALVALDDPDGPRAFTDVVCDRVHARSDVATCLATERGIATTFAARLYDADWSLVGEWPLPGIPSRTRLSEDGALLSTTSFVTGHSYATSGFVTATEIHGPDVEHGNLEEFALVLDGERISPVDRNIWGVTFAGGSRFYATAQSQTYGSTWLVEGDLDTRTLTVLRDGVECPAISPDGSRIAFKKVATPPPNLTWNVAVLDLATGEETLLAGETRNVDDQVEWLDDETVLYGLPRADEPGVTDVWSLGVTARAQPELFIPQAWSPAVVRE